MRVSGVREDERGRSVVRPRPAEHQVDRSTGDGEVREVPVIATDLERLPSAR
jgi:hypothetical protein